MRKDIAKFDMDVLQASLGSAQLRAFDHDRFDVERVHIFCRPASHRYRKCTVAAAKFRHDAFAVCASQTVQNQRDIEERFPIDFLGHSTFRHFHRVAASAGNVSRRKIVSTWEGDSFGLRSNHQNKTENSASTANCTTASRGISSVRVWGLALHKSWRITSASSRLILRITIGPPSFLRSAWKTSQYSCTCSKNTRLKPSKGGFASPGAASASLRWASSAACKCCSPLSNRPSLLP